MFLRRIAVVAAVVAALVAPTPASAAESDDYVALADSYSSGIGTYATNLDVGCYRGTYAHPYLVSTARANTQLTFIACQGATTDDVVDSQLVSSARGPTSSRSPSAATTSASAI